MDTPNSKSKAVFTRLSGGGYDADEVDNVVATLRAEVADLSRDVRRSARKTEGGSVERLHDPDRAVERMLAAAQQTADRVVYEAEAESERILAEADEDALRRVNSAEETSQLRVSEAESQGERIRKEAVTEARRVVEETRGPLAREVKALRDTRDELRTEIDGLRRLLSAHRNRVREAADELRQLADDPDVFRVVDPGPETAVDVNLDDDFVIDVGADIDLRDAPASVSAPSAPAKAATSAAPAPAKPAAKPKPVADAKPAAAKTEAKAAPKSAPAPEVSASPTSASPTPLNSRTDDRRSATPAAGQPAAHDESSPESVQRKSAFAAAIDEDELPSSGSARIVTLDDLGRDAEPLWSGDNSSSRGDADSGSDDSAVSPIKAASAAAADAPASGGARVISGAFADSLDTEDDDSLGDLGENSGGSGFLSKVREAAGADDGLGEVGDDQDRKISNFFEDMTSKDEKGRFGRRK